jgi:hypothetical protein
LKAIREIGIKAVECLETLTKLVRLHERRVTIELLNELLQCIHEPWKLHSLSNRPNKKGAAWGSAFVVSD